MSADPIVSVLVTSYNRERYVAESIESVLCQTFGDFELIVSDNRSTDATLEIVNAFARRDSRVRVSVNDTNIGQFGNRRKAASLARGRFLKYHDSDDLMYRHCLAAMVEPLDAEPRAAFALSGSHHWPGGPCPMLLTPRLAYEREYLGSGLFQLGPSSALFRTEAFHELGGFPESGVASDYLFWIRSCARVNVLLVPGDLFYYRTHPDQEFADPRNDAEYARAMSAAWAMLNSAECPLEGAAREQAKRNFTYTSARGAYRALKQRRPGSAAAIVRYAGPDMLDWIRYLRPPRRSANAGTPVEDASARRDERVRRVDPMSAQPSVSVLLTTYNRERYVSEAIESVLAQTFEDFELVVSDDCSSDRTLEIVNGYARRDRRIRVSVNERNLGDYGNRRHIASLATGRYLKYHDSDDVMYRHCLEAMIEPLEAEPRAAFALSGGHHWPGGPCPMLLTPRLAYEREYLGSGLFQLGPSSALFRTDVFHELGGFPESGVASDYIFWIRACRRVSVLLVPADLFYYRVHPEQEAANPQSDVRYARAMSAAWAMLNSVECPLEGAAGEQAKRNFTYTSARGAYRALKQRRPGSAAAILRHSGPDMLDWIRYLRPPRRSATAGTSVEDAGPRRDESGGSIR